MGWEALEHTADLGLRVWGTGVDEVFAEAAVALVALMGEAPGPDVHEEHIELEAADLDALLVDWLSEILFLFEARGVVPRQVEAQVEASGTGLSAVVRGPDADGFVQRGPAVKAVTFHGLEWHRTASETEARVYLDV